MQAALKPGVAFRQGAGEALVFMAQWARAPLRMGSLVPSSQVLARAMTRQIPASALSGGEYVVELGGGTGSITAGLLAGGIAPDRLIVIEADHGLAEHLTRRFPGVTILCGNAEKLETLLAARGIHAAAAIVSGLPLLLFPQESRDRIVRGCMALLGPSRPLIQFTYGLSSPLPHLAYGLEAKRVERVWRNLPPAAVWIFRQRAGV
jgi:phosphatidylethanolamine/phosphatidyl-N-methylethanolamine N-methyltransferase